jgi:hypothetical protein
MHHQAAGVPLRKEPAYPILWISLVKLCSSIMNLTLHDMRNLGNVDLVPDQTSGSFILSVEKTAGRRAAGLAYRRMVGSIVM